MTERDMGGRLRRSGVLEGLSGPGPGRQEPVLFWAEREPAFYLRATAISALLMIPVAFFMPALFVLFLALLSLSGWINARAFRFEVGPRTLTVRQSLLLPRMTFPLADIASLADRPDPGGRLLGAAAGTGLLMVHLRGGRTLVVPGLKDVKDAVTAIRSIQAGQGRPGPAGPRSGGGAVAAG